MHASTSAPVLETDAAARLAEQLLTLWMRVARPRGLDTYAIFEELDLTLTQVKLMSALSDDELTVKELAELLGLSLPGASRAVDGLVERGLLHRREDSADRRMKRVSCTADGRRALERLDEARLAGIESFTATLPPAQIKRLSGALRPILGELPKEDR
jgi:DNA-binding MarR family transcriptional regulator